MARMGFLADLIRRVAKVETEMSQLVQIVFTSL